MVLTWGTGASPRAAPRCWTQVSGPLSFDRLPPRDGWRTCASHVKVQPFCRRAMGLLVKAQFKGALLSLPGIPALSSPVQADASLVGLLSCLFSSVLPLCVFRLWDLISLCFAFPGPVKKNVCGKTMIIHRNETITGEKGFHCASLCGNIVQENTTSSCFHKDKFSTFDGMLMLGFVL